MAASSAIFRSFAQTGTSISDADRTVETLRQYFVQHPEVEPREFVLQAVENEIVSREGQESKRRRFARANRPWRDAAERPTAEDVRIHAWLQNRLMRLHQERSGLRAKMHRFFTGNRVVRWLTGNHSQLSH